MAVVSSFDQWKKDVFFSAAEEVQESADKMESVYRIWIRNCEDGLQSEDSDALLMELQAALGTAKWQLEEFERAVRLSHERLSQEENTISRHRHFISAIEYQISHIEKELSDSLGEDGKRPLRWVQLDHEEVDDLASFLSGAQERGSKEVGKDGSSSPFKIRAEFRGEYKDGFAKNMNVKYVEDVSAKEPSAMNDAKLPRAVVLLNEQKIGLTAPDMGDWKIVIADQEEADERSVEARQELPNQASNPFSLSGNIRSTAKLKWFSNSFSKAKSEKHLHLRNKLSNRLDFKQVARLDWGLDRFTDRGKNCFSSCKEGYRLSTTRLLAGRIGGLHRHLQGSQYYTQFGRSLRFTFLLVLSIFLVGNFVMFSRLVLLAEALN